MVQLNVKPLRELYAVPIGSSGFSVVVPALCSGAGPTPSQTDGQRVQTGLVRNWYPWEDLNQGFCMSDIEVVQKSLEPYENVMGPRLTATSIPPCGLALGRASFFWAPSVRMSSPSTF